jgi:hypothetical protein
VIVIGPLLALQIELEETKALLLLHRVQGNIRRALERLKGDLETEIEARMFEENSREILESRPCESHGPPDR